MVHVTISYVWYVISYRSDGQGCRTYFHKLIKYCRILRLSFPPVFRQSSPAFQAKSCQCSDFPRLNFGWMAICILICIWGFTYLIPVTLTCWLGGSSINGSIFRCRLSKELPCHSMLGRASSSSQILASQARCS